MQYIYIYIIAVCTEIYIVKTALDYRLQLYNTYSNNKD